MSLLVHVGIFLMLLFYHDTRSKGFSSATTVELVSETPVQKSIDHKPVQEKLTKPSPPVHPAAVTQKHAHLDRNATVRVHPPKPHKKKIVAHPILRKNKTAISKKKVSHPKKPVLHHAKPISPTKVHPEAKAVPNPSSVVNSNPTPVKMDIAGESFPTYLEHLLISRIKSNWFPPPGTKGLRATVTFTLKKDGQLAKSPSIVSGSGNGMFDDAARMAVLRSVPFPPFPSSYTKDQESVTVTLEAIQHGGVFDGQ
ncbi:MAG: energy transducer TonB [Leptospirales bacterium]